MPGQCTPVKTPRKRGLGDLCLWSVGVPAGACALSAGGTARGQSSLCPSLQHCPTPEGPRKEGQSRQGGNEKVQGQLLGVAFASSPLRVPRALHSPCFCPHLFSLPATHPARCSRRQPQIWSVHCPQSQPAHLLSTTPGPSTVWFMATLHLVPAFHQKAGL